MFICVPYSNKVLDLLLISLSLYLWQMKNMKIYLLKKVLKRAFLFRNKSCEIYYNGNYQIK
jgi:hypothetical protein